MNDVYICTHVQGNGWQTRKPSFCALSRHAVYLRAHRYLEETLASEIARDHRWGRASQLILMFFMQSMLTR